MAYKEGTWLLISSCCTQCRVCQLYNVRHREWWSAALMPVSNRCWFGTGGNDRSCLCSATRVVGEKTRKRGTKGGVLTMFASSGSSLSYCTIARNEMPAPKTSTEKGGTLPHIVISHTRRTTKDRVSRSAKVIMMQKIQWKDTQSNGLVFYVHLTVCS